MQAGQRVASASAGESKGGKDRTGRTTSSSSRWSAPSARLCAFCAARYLFCRVRAASRRGSAPLPLLPEFERGGAGEGGLFEPIPRGRAQDARRGGGEGRTAHLPLVLVSLEPDGARTQVGLDALCARELALELLLELLGRRLEVVCPPWSVEGSSPQQRVRPGQAQEAKGRGQGGRTELGFRVLERAVDVEVARAKVGGLELGAREAARRGRGASTKGARGGRARARTPQGGREGGPTLRARRRRRRCMRSRRATTAVTRACPSEGEGCMRARGRLTADGCKGRCLLGTEAATAHLPLCPAATPRPSPSTLRP